MAAQRECFAAATVAAGTAGVGGAAGGDVVFADEAGDFFEVGGVVNSGADEFDGGGGPEGVEAVAAPTTAGLGADQKSSPPFSVVRISAGSAARDARPVQRW